MHLDHLDTNVKPSMNYYSNTQNRSESCKHSRLQTLYLIESKSPNKKIEKPNKIVYDPFVVSTLEECRRQIKQLDEANMRKKLDERGGLFVNEDEQYRSNNSVRFRAIMCIDN